MKNIFEWEKRDVERNVGWERNVDIWLLFTFLFFRYLKRKKYKKLFEWFTLETDSFLDLSNSFPHKNCSWTVLLFLLTQHHLHLHSARFLLVSSAYSSRTAWIQEGGSHGYNSWKMFKSARSIQYTISLHSLALCYNLILTLRNFSITFTASIPRSYLLFVSRFHCFTSHQ